MAKVKTGKGSKIETSVEVIQPSKDQIELHFSGDETYIDLSAAEALELRDKLIGLDL